ncbi:MAG TPA: CHAD domain-containing protein [Bryobacteraceae bacterium]|jgi:CHAD domain-containing protein
MSMETQDRLKVLAVSLRRARQHPHNAEAIHKLRVAIRRFTQALRVFQDSFDPAHIRKIRRRLRKLMDLCGAARNCDIAVEVLEAAAVPADKPLQRELRRLRSRAERELVKRLSEKDSRVDTHHWRTWLKSPAAVEAGTVLPKLARDFSKAGTAAVRAQATYSEIHQFRLLVKRYRYTLEILGGPDQLLGLLRRLQEHLGAINDCVTTAELLDECGVQGVDLRRIKTALNRLLAHRTVEFRMYWRHHKP